MNSFWGASSADTSRQITQRRVNISFWRPLGAFLYIYALPHTIKFPTRNAVLNTLPLVLAFAMIQSTVSLIPLRKLYLYSASPDPHSKTCWTSFLLFTYNMNSCRRYSGLDNTFVEALSDVRANR
jgi:hypothetical protein